jgi:hypothetical protein
MLLYDPQNLYNTKQRYLDDVTAIINLMSDSNFSPIVSDKYLNYSDELSDIFLTNQDKINNFDIVDFITDVKLLESNLLNDIDLYPNSIFLSETIDLLISSSVARYSAAY